MSQGGEKRGDDRDDLGIPQAKRVKTEGGSGVVDASPATSARDAEDVREPSIKRARINHVGIKHVDWQ